MPVDFLTTEQTESYGRFTGEPDELQLARYFHLDEADKEFIGKSRGDHNRLGIALQIGCVRFLGTFLTDMNHIPSGVRHFIARQLAIHDITVLAEYGQGENTRREHAALIRQHYDNASAASLTVAVDLLSSATVTSGACSLKNSLTFSTLIATPA